jgi:hypothetical protein
MQMKLNLKEKDWKFKLGLILMLSSLVFFALLVIIPLLDIERQVKITYTSISFVIAEVLFYSGGFLVGKEVFKKYKAYFTPVNWFKKKKVETKEDVV